MSKNLLIGVDEVGRGSLAGPVVSGAVILGAKWPNKIVLQDSKKLTAKKRHELSQLIKAHCQAWSIGQASALEIDQLGIAQANHVAMQRAVAQLSVRSGEAKILIDGRPPRCLRELPWDHEFEYIVKGDALHPCISAASMIAKVYRDELMSELGTKYLQYHWDKNAGYGTADHRHAIQEHGLSSEHRRLFCRNVLNRNT